jgi:hypothetical protein
MSIFSGLLERLLDISKFDAGLVKPQIASFDLAGLFSWMEQNFAQAALDKKLHFRLYFPMNSSLIVRTDIVLLQSVLMNLVTNAIKFTTHGGILISARQRDDKVLLQISDMVASCDQWELHAHAAAGVVKRVNVDHAAVAVDDFLCHREPQPEMLPRRALGGEEGLEHFVAQLVGDARPAVFDKNFNVVGMRGAKNTQFAPTAAPLVH